MSDVHVQIYKLVQAWVDAAMMNDLTSNHDNVNCLKIINYLLYRLHLSSTTILFTKDHCKADICNRDPCASNITEISSEVYCDSIDFTMKHEITRRQNHDSSDNKIRLHIFREKVGSIDPSTSLNTTNAGSSSNVNEFDRRPIKHHSFVSEVPDVKHMERALLGLLDDFHSGKLKAFGSGCTMEQMTKIREQQESLAKLHFELAAAEEDSLESVHDLNAAKAQENMLQLVQRLEQLSVSIEQLQSSHLGL
nr:uncharacterized protein LOC106615038 isoform X3 [Bactrocera oleae]XP_036225629.1 uncharacterized protein LOC106615038 isoform X3 [Bactrocera oleae]